MNTDFNVRLVCLIRLFVFRQLLLSDKRFCRRIYVINTNCNRVLVAHKYIRNDETFLYSFVHLS